MAVSESSCEFSKEQLAYPRAHHKRIHLIAQRGSIIFFFLLFSVVDPPKALARNPGSRAFFQSPKHDGGGRGSLAWGRLGFCCACKTFMKGNRITNKASEKGVWLKKKAFCFVLFSMFLTENELLCKCDAQNLGVPKGLQEQ
ncbi:hypothetical protein HPP92_025623 [Vanilla planifolia]|uniref:Uncharacterized protein n=1 Tax=Vanilla planifolia TaxID=51239 RepID=A0A835PMB9_VANPL|nr:hypothetical protein HPP92_025623 [Vanilla planifolia]